MTGTVYDWINVSRLLKANGHHKDARRFVLKINGANISISFQRHDLKICKFKIGHNGPSASIEQLSKFAAAASCKADDNFAAVIVRNFQPAGLLHV